MSTINNTTIDLLVDRLVLRVNEMVKHAVYNYRSERGKRVKWKDERNEDLNGYYLTFKKVTEYIPKAIDALSVAVEREGMSIDTEQAKMSLLNDANNAFTTYEDTFSQEELYNRLNVEYIFED